MRNLYTKQEFLVEKNNQLNEGLFGMLKNLVKGVKKLYGKIKGSKEVVKIFEKYTVEIEGVFQKMGEAEMSKSAGAANVKAGVEESLIIEADVAAQTGIDTTPAQTTESGDEETTPAGLEDKEAQQQEEKNKFAGLDKNQLQNLIKITQKRISDLGKRFDKEVDEILKRYTSKEGVVSKRLQLLSSVKKNEMVDKIYARWMDFYDTIGDKQKLVESQKQRQKVAGEYKEAVENLQKMVNVKEKEKSVFKVGEQYKYYSKSEEKEITIEILKVDENGKILDDGAKNIESGNTLNPLTANIRDQVQVQPQTQAQGQAQVQDKKAQ